jgi:hypothetical protein
MVVNGEYVDLLMLMERFGVTDLQACKLMLACFERGLRDSSLPGSLLPTTRSYFAKPADGRPAEYEYRATKKTERGKDQILDVIRGRPELGFTLRDLYASIHGKGATKNSQLNPIRVKAYELIANNKIEARRAADGLGSFGKPPIIFGMSEQGILARERLLLEDKTTRRKSGRKSNEYRTKASRWLELKARESKLSFDELDEAFELGVWLNNNGGRPENSK